MAKKAVPATKAISIPEVGGTKIKNKISAVISADSIFKGWPLNCDNKTLVPKQKANKIISDTSIAHGENGSMPNNAKTIDMIASAPKP